MSIVSKKLNKKILACGPMVCLKFVRVAVRGTLKFVSFWVGRALLDIPRTGRDVFEIDLLCSSIENVRVEACSNKTRQS